MARRKRRSYAGRIILLIILLIAALLILGITIYKDRIVKTVGTKVATTAIEQIIKSETGSSINIDEIKSHMDEEDVEEFDGIVDKYTDADKLEECIELYRNQGTQAVKEYVKEEVEGEDIDKLKELYEKYKNKIDIQ